MDWWPDNPTVGEWKQKLVPPRSDPTFDFLGESVQETPALGIPGEDTCWFKKSEKSIVLSISGGIWPVESGNVWKPDQVGWTPDAVTYYRNPTPPPPPAPPGPPPPSTVPCGFTIWQQMTIKAPSDGITYNNYGPVNALRGKMTKNEVTSERAGKSRTKKWPPK